MDAKARKIFLVLLERWKVVLGGCIAIAVPTVTAYTSYRESLSDIRTEFVQVRLENEQLFVKKDEMAEVTKRLEVIGDRTNQILGMMKAERRRRDER